MWAAIVLAASLVVCASAVPHERRATLESVCNVNYARSKLPTGDLGIGVTIHNLLLSTQVVRGFTGGSKRNAANYVSPIDFCKVSFSYNNNLRIDNINLELWMPDPSQFQNRWMTTGGYTYYINADGNDCPLGIINGAATGFTDAGFGSFQATLDTVTPISTGVPNLNAIIMFGHDAIKELSVIGKEFTRNFYNVRDTQHIFSYFAGCSEAGREGLDLAQHAFLDARGQPLMDGIVASAPSIRYAQAQLNHFFPMVTMINEGGFFPSPCEFMRVTQYMVDECDALDGRQDGIVARTDLCQLHINLNGATGLPFSCPAQKGGPAQHGRVDQRTPRLVQKMLNGLQDIQGKQIYYYLQHSSYLGDSDAVWDGIFQRWTAGIINNMGWSNLYLARILRNWRIAELITLIGTTYDKLALWMKEGMDLHGDLQSGNANLADYFNQNNKIIMFVGEVDEVIPPKAIAAYYESVREVVYPQLNYRDGIGALQGHARFYLVPGAIHCDQGNQQLGPWPGTALEQMIAWVESGIVPDTLHAKPYSGPNAGQEWELCSYPLRPRWNGGAQICEWDQASIDTWQVKLDYSTFLGGRVY